MKTLEASLKDIYKRANYVQIADRIRRRKFMKITSVCASFCIVFIIAAVVMIRPFDDATSDNTTKLEGKNDDKLWVSDISGAVYMENSEFQINSPSYDIYPMNKYDHTTYLRSKSKIVVGEVENIKRFFIDYHRFENGYDSYYITTFDIKIKQEIKGEFETSTLKCVSYIDCFRMDSNPNYLHPRVTCGIPDIGREIVDNPSGLFVLKSTENDSWRVGRERYNVSDYADYYVTDRYNCNSDGVEYINEVIGFDEIRYTPEFYYTSTKEDDNKEYNNKEDDNTDLWKAEDGFALLDDRKLSGTSYKWVKDKIVNKTKTVDGLGTFIYQESEKIEGSSARNYVEWVYDTYVSEDKSKTVIFLEDVDVMTYYCDNSIVQTGEKIDELKAKDLADDFIEKYNRYIIEDSILFGHSHEYSFISSDNSTPGTFTISYVKHIKGVPTDATWTICVSEYGQIISYEGKNSRKYSQYKHIVSAEKIDEAQARLEKVLGKINIDYSIGENRYLAVDSDDEIYLSLTVEVKIGKETVPQQFFVPLFYPTV